MTVLASRRPGGLLASPDEVPARHKVLRALATKEARRMLRSPWLLGGAVLTGVATSAWAGPQEWNGARYNSWFYLPAGLYLATSVIVASAFHRERAAVALEAPVGEGGRCAARLLAATSLVAVVAAFVGGLAAYVWSTGGLDLGDEPGRTVHAHPTLAELCQPVAVTVLAVTVGAAAGRHLRHRVTAALVLLTGWFPVTFSYWLFQHELVAPFSILQAQPVPVEIGPPATDPQTFPATWLLEAPSEYQDHWARLVVSEPLAWWHTGWLLGLSVLALAAAVPAGRRRVLAAAGAALAAVSVVAQFLVYP